jgi:hypothetical protein
MGPQRKRLNDSMSETIRLTERFRGAPPEFWSQIGRGENGRIAYDVEEDKPWLTKVSALA